LGKNLVYKVEVLMGCQKILDPKNTQTLERKTKKNEGFYEDGKKRCTS
jgi:hypothetical protein